MRIGDAAELIESRIDWLEENRDTHWSRAEIAALARALLAMEHEAALSGEVAQMESEIESLRMRLEGES